jgi:hypothetical protein
MLKPTPPSAWSKVFKGRRIEESPTVSIVSEGGSEESQRRRKEERRRDSLVPSSVRC